MPPAETVRREPPAPAAAAVPAPAVLHGWGGGPGVSVLLVRPAGPDGMREAVGPGLDGHGGAIARGLGRSYGDAAQLTDGLVLETSRLKGFELDPAAGAVTAAAGVTLAELLGALVPVGWMVPVVPGTQHVTVGGAIASDIHGKNHGADGTFGRHVTSIGLLTSGGEVIELAPNRPGRVFEATLGGMGLTGVILWATIRMRPVSSPFVSVDTDRVDDLDGALEALSAPGGSHRVAWLDLLSGRPARGVVTRAEHLDATAAASRKGQATVRALAAVPERWPAGVLRPSTVRAFNELRFRRTPRRERGGVEGIGAHMFPLDVLDAWPRLYGRDGFLQYQLVVPPGEERVLHETIARLRRSRVPCYLCVLKDLGPANDAPLSFPIEGWTITYDIPRAAPGLDRLLDEFDELVAAAGGRVYLSKDVRMRLDALEAMYPRLGEWREIRDRVDPEGAWRSDLGLRTGLVWPATE